MHLASQNTARKAQAPVGGFDPEVLRDTNVNPATLLATDYLNHFNDAAATIEMLPHMPDCFAGIADWSPRGYCEHFRKSALRDAEIALDAWHYVPPHVKALFDEMVDELNAATVRAIVTARIALETGDERIIAQSCARAAGELHALIREAGDIVNGTALRRGRLAAAG